MTFADAVTGTDTILAMSTLEFDSALAANQTISFSGSNGTLKLMDPLGYAGSHIAGFAVTDTVELGGSWSFSSFSENAGGTLGTLTLTNGTNNVAFNFAGDFTSSSFSIETGTNTTHRPHLTASARTLGRALRRVSDVRLCLDGLTYATTTKSVLLSVGLPLR